MSILETQRGKVLELASGKSSARGRRHKIVSIAAAPQFGSPRNLFSAWDEIADDIREARSIAVLSDFDGSLVKIQRQPNAVRLAKPVRSVLAELASHDVMVGIISGRSLTDVRKRVGLTGISYVGCQGYSIQDARGHRITLANRDERRLLATATEQLKKRLAGLEGSRCITAKRVAPLRRARNALLPKRSRRIAVCASAAAKKFGKFSRDRAWISGPRFDSCSLAKGTWNRC
jgi:hypothetical protein